MIQLQPGYQSSNDLCLSCCMSIANDNSASNNSLGEFFFDQLFFPFLFSRTERTRFGWCGLLVEQHAAKAGGKTGALWYDSVATGVPVFQRSALVVLHVDRKRQFGQQQQSLGILFCEILFSFSLFLAQSERVSVGGDRSSNNMQTTRSRWEDLCRMV